MMKPSGYSLAACLLFVLDVVSQTITFERHYGWLNYERAEHVYQHSDGGYFLIGRSGPFISGGYMYMFKTDSLGNIEWSKDYDYLADYLADNYAFAANQTDDGGYVIIASGSSDIWLIKTDMNGDTLWTKKTIISGVDIMQTRDGGYIICGTKYNGANQDDFYLVKTDMNGDTLWTKTYGTTLEEGASSIKQAPDSSYIILGYVRPTMFTRDILVIKTDSNGDTVWTRNLGEHGSEEIILAVDDGYIVRGNTEQFAPDNLSGDVLFKLDTNGNVLWKKIYGGTYSWFVSTTGIVQTGDGGFLMPGMRTFTDPNVGGGHTFMYLLKLNGDGDTLWSRVFDGLVDEGQDAAESVIQTRDGGYALAGDRYMGALMKSDAYLIKTDSLGNVNTSTGFPDYLQSAHGKLLIHPNPFNESATVHISGHPQNFPDAVLAVYDITGREVKTYSIDGQQQRLVISKHEIGPGIFLFRLSIGTAVLSMKKVVITE